MNIEVQRGTEKNGEEQKAVAKMKEQAEALKLRLEQEKEALDGLKAAIDSQDMATLGAFLKQCNEMGLKTPEVESGAKLYESMQAKLAAKKALAAMLSTQQGTAQRAAFVWWRETGRKLRIY